MIPDHPKGLYTKVSTFKKNILAGMNGLLRGLSRFVVRAVLRVPFNIFAHSKHSQSVPYRSSRMFVSFNLQDIEHNGMLMYYSDPSHVNPKRDSWPPAAILMEDLSLHVRFEKCPELKLIYYAKPYDDISPTVLDGFLKIVDGEVIFLEDTGQNIRLDEMKYEEENQRCKEEYFPFRDLPILTTEGNVEWKTVTQFYESFAGKKIVVSWIAALLLQLSKTTAELLSFLKLSQEEQRKQLKTRYESRIEVETSTSCSGPTFIWCWWSFPKPENLGSFCSKFWNCSVPFLSFLDTYNLGHPLMSGFYRVLVSDFGSSNPETSSSSEDASEDPTVILTWWNAPSKSYQVQIGLPGKKIGREHGFGPNCEGKVLLTIQNSSKHFLISEEEYSSWEVKCKALPDDCFFVSSDVSKAPCKYSTVLHPHANEAHKLLFIDNALCPSKPLPEDVHRAFKLQGILMENLLWK